MPEGTVPVFHEDVRVWEVTNKDTGEHVGLWYLDPFFAPGETLRCLGHELPQPHTFDGKKTVLSSNSSNFIKGDAGAPVLVSWDDATTFFHEFGHALHSLSSNVEYPTLNRRGARPHRVPVPAARALAAHGPRHQGLLDPSPDGRADAGGARRQDQARLHVWLQGFQTTEYLASALMDLRYHTTDPSSMNPDEFERTSLASLGMPAEVVMRHRSPQFGHVFSGEGYATGYYGYLWADVLTADAAEAFAEKPGRLLRSRSPLGWSSISSRHGTPSIRRTPIGRSEVVTPTSRPSCEIEVSRF